MSNNSQYDTPTALAPHAAVVIVPGDLLARFILDAVNLAGRFVAGAAKAVRRSSSFKDRAISAPVSLVLVLGNFIADAIRPW